MPALCGEKRGFRIGMLKHLGIRDNLLTKAPYIMLQLHFNPAYGDEIGVKI